MIFGGTDKAELPPPKELDPMTERLRQMASDEKALAMVQSEPRVDRKTGAVEVIIRVTPPPRNGRVAYAAAPPADRRFSFAGSGMPFINSKEALESHRASRGVANVDLDGTFTARLESGMPGSYYAGLGTYLIPPCVHVTYVSDRTRERVRLVALIGVHSIPHRTLGHPPGRTGAHFYAPKDAAATDDDDDAGIIRSQDRILVDSSWREWVPRWLTTAFWGKKPPG